MRYTKEFYKLVESFTPAQRLQISCLDKMAELMRINASVCTDDEQRAKFLKKEAGYIGQVKRLARRFSG